MALLHWSEGLHHARTVIVNQYVTHTGTGVLLFILSLETYFIFRPPNWHLKVSLR